MVKNMLHPALSRFLANQRAGEGNRNADGSVSIVFDGQYRVTCMAFAQGGLLLEARIFQLPAESSYRRSSIEMLLEQAGHRLKTYTEWLALASGGQMLMLQQVVPAQADSMQFSAMLDSFVNALAGWRRLAGVL